MMAHPSAGRASIVSKTSERASRHAGRDNSRSSRPRTRGVRLASPFHRCARTHAPWAATPPGLARALGKPPIKFRANLQ